MAKTVQTTFTKQKRQLAKANALIGTIRAQETRTQRFDADAKLETEERTAYIVDAPENIASQVVEIIADVVRQHGARQRANSVSKGRFEFCGIEADLTVPQLRALQEAQTTLAALVDKPVHGMFWFGKGLFELGSASVRKIKGQRLIGSLSAALGVLMILAYVIHLAMSIGTGR